MTEPVVTVKGKMADFDANLTLDFRLVKGLLSFVVGLEDPPLP